MTVDWTLNQIKIHKSYNFLQILWAVGEYLKGISILDNSVNSKFSDCGCEGESHFHQEMNVEVSRGETH